MCDIGRNTYNGGRQDEHSGLDYTCFDSLLYDRCNPYYVPEQEEQKKLLWGKLFPLYTGLPELQTWQNSFKKR